MASTDLRFTSSSTGNNKIGTWSCWVKRSGLGSYQTLVQGAGDASGNYVDRIGFTDSDQLRIIFYANATDGEYITTAKYRDTSAWYHVVMAIDTTQATASNRVKLYVNGEQVTDFGTETQIAQNRTLQFNVSGCVYSVGSRYKTSTDQYLDGEMAHAHWIDGTAYDASAFGQTESSSGIWKPKLSPSVTYGTNGFFLKFQDSSSLGDDSSGNTNDFTLSGTGTQTLDTPSNVFAVLNPLASPGASITLGNANNSVTAIADNDWKIGTISSNFKWYAECKINVAHDGSGGGICIGAMAEAGITQNNGTTFSGLSNANAKWYTNSNDGKFQEGGGTNVTTGLTRATLNDIVGVACDSANGRVYIHVNGTYLNSGDPVAGTGYIGGTAGYQGVWFPFHGAHLTKGTGSWNFGSGYFGTTAVSSANSDSAGIGKFEYSVPSGYYALCTKNIAEYG